ncbi:hypothetical protein WN55_08530 [Dufourea novaeangliae]|uniref:Uncharacterized protein n=1 Tax=Dufourea novaeangliae TaxID=178035 RepID=A0A154P7H6_DUFNO|nr:hypothetical protein WN55_08530 [Dufourea novaeangliae]
MDIDDDFHKRCSGTSKLQFLSTDIFEYQSLSNNRGQVRKPRDQSQENLISLPNNDRDEEKRVVVTASISHPQVVRWIRRLLSLALIYRLLAFDTVISTVVPDREDPLNPPDQCPPVVSRRGKTSTRSADAKELRFLRCALVFMGSRWSQACAYRCADRIYVVMDEPILHIPPTITTNFNRIRHRKASGEIIADSYYEDGPDPFDEEETSLFTLSDIELLQCALLVFKKRINDDPGAKFRYMFAETPKIYSSEFIDVDRQVHILFKGFPQPKLKPIHEPFPEPKKILHSVEPAVREEILRERNDARSAARESRGPCGSSKNTMHAHRLVVDGGLP